VHYFSSACACSILACLVAMSPADQPAARERPATGTPASAEEIDRLILQLGDDDLEKRKQAVSRLEAVGNPALDPLKKAVESSDDPEVRTAAKALLEKFDAKARGLLHVFKGHSPPITAVAISADGKVAVSSYSDFAVRVWDLENFTMTRQYAEHVTTVMSLALSPDGKRVVSGSSARMIRLWDRETGKEIRNFIAPAETIYDLALSPDGKLVLSGWGDGNVRLFDVMSGRLVQTLQACPGGRAWTVAFTQHGKQAVTGGGYSQKRGTEASGPLLLWDVASGQLVRRFEGHTNDVRRVAVSPDGTRLLSAGYDGKVRLWELGTGGEIKKFDTLGGFVETLSFAADGRQALWSHSRTGVRTGRRGDANGSVELWDLAAGKELKQFPGHTGTITCIAVSADGKRLISGCDDGSMRVWELPR
jgi:WD40 repeat protein